ncbi:MAG TPA: phosphatidate cytidylyltransferase [Syntrophorhabdaceae bacterium]|nr:phosphatidate cytidylyltransferase [Syntrophorhabdaceae bacterium]
MGELKKRVLAASILAPFVAALFYFLPDPGFFALIALVVLLAFYEIVHMAHVPGKYLLIALALVSLTPLYSKAFDFYLLCLIASPLIYLLFLLFNRAGDRQDVNRDIVTGIAAQLFGGVFIVLPLFAVYLLKQLSSLFPLVLLLTIWASDTCAYFLGKKFGRRPLAPQISPKKTYEGLIGAILGSMAVICLSHRLLHFGMAASLGIGAAMGVLGQAGDLLESMGKRVLHRKDSSSLIPGHGGILDRIDSFIFTAPLLYICTAWKG